MKMNVRSRALRPTASAIRLGLAGVVALGVATAALAQAEKPLTIGVIELFPNPHFAHARKGIEEFARKNNTNVIIQNANLDATKEAQFVQTFVTRKVDAILLSAVSPTGSLATLRLAKSAGIPVVCYTTCVNPPDDKELVQAFVKSDNTVLGVTTGKQGLMDLRQCAVALTECLRVGVDCRDQCFDAFEAFLGHHMAERVLGGDRLVAFLAQHALEHRDRLLTHPLCRFAGCRTCRQVTAHLTPGDAEGLVDHRR